jgi:hypothetical protein
MEKTQPNIDLTHTTGIKNSQGGSIFQQGIILRKVSKFLVGTTEDGIIPIPVFYDPHTYQIFSDGLPKELRDELKEESI